VEVILCLRTRADFHQPFQRVGIENSARNIVDMSETLAGGRIKNRAPRATAVLRFDAKDGGIELVQIEC